MERVIKFFKDVDELRGRLEFYLVNFASGIIPWFAAIIPAYFAYVHVKDILEVPFYFAFVFAAVIEVLGFASVSTFIEFRNLRERYASSTIKGSVSPVIPILSFGMYLLVIVLVNGILSFVERVDIAILYTSIVSQDTQSIVVYLFEPIAISFSIFVLSFMTIPGAVIVASRTTQERFLKEKGLLGREREKTVSQGEISATEPKKTGVTKQKERRLKPGEKKLLSVLDSDKNSMKNMTQLAELVGVSRPTLYKYDRDLRAAGYYKVTPAGTVFDLKGEL